MRLTIVGFFIFLCSCSMASAQSILDLQMDGREEGKPVGDFLLELGQAREARFYFLPEWLQPLSFKESYKGFTLDEALEKVFLGTDLSYFAMYPKTIVIVKDPSQAISRHRAIRSALRQQKKIESAVFGEIGKSQQKQIIIRGRVVDSKSKEPMARASVQVSETQGIVTNDEGYYQLTLPPGAYVLRFSFSEYEDKIVDVAAYSDGELNQEMDEVPVLLDEVVIQDNAARELTTGRIGQVQISIRDIKRLPSLLGEADLIKQVQLLPGVTTVGEAASGFNVRGGSVDQNLILHDGLPIFNTAHAFGFFSSFNPESIRNVSFYRGGIPAEYGGRVSSVMDIQSREGDFRKWNGNAGIGLMTGNAMINGPIKKEKTSVMASLRSTYSNWLVRSIKTDYADLRKSYVFFYDATAKVTHLIDEKTKLSVTGYSSKDAFRLMGDSTFQWANFQLSGTLNREFSDVLHAEFTAGSSSYGYDVVNRNEATASTLSYRITTSTLKAGFNYQRAQHKMNFGWQLWHYHFNPGSFTPNSPTSNAGNLSLEKQNSFEHVLYAGDEFALNSALSVEAGLRLPVFTSLGKASVFTYERGQPKDVLTIVDTLRFKSAAPIKTYLGAEPRLSLRWMVRPSASVKLGYNRLYQFLHLVTNSTAVTPVDIWQPSGYYFKPQRADQISLGYFLDVKGKKYGFSTEAFYKNIHNILDFKDGAQLILNKHIETDLLQGRGLSYGMESSLAKNTGRLTGTLNYTYSRSFRIITGPTGVESINQGQRYPSNFDQPHILNVAWKYSLSRRYYLTGNFTYHTGRPVTIPLSVFTFENTSVAYFSSRNQYRIPDYHRLDLALVVEAGHRRKKLGDGAWVFSVYNVYSRKNPYAIFFKSDGGGIPKPYQLSIVGTVLPSVTYNFKF